MADSASSARSRNHKRTNGVANGAFHSPSRLKKSPPMVASRYASQRVKLGIQGQSCGRGLQETMC